MDHNNPSKQYSHTMCTHGRCSDHDPEWENVGRARFEPLPDILGIKILLWGHRCCGKPMIRCKKVQTQRCKKCGRTRDYIEEHADGGIFRYAVCQCCGDHYGGFW